jgi:alpha-glucosidase (family GH31 glycosyl hydrolase)
MKMVPIDGLWIDMNEPASFCDGHCYPGVEAETDVDGQVVMGNSIQTQADPRNPAYKINNAGWEAPLILKTVSPDAQHFNKTLHYDLHNLYGHMESIMTRQSLLDISPKKRPFVLSRSTFPGTGVHAGHWTGDNWSSWEHLYLSIPSILSFQLFGIPLVGADICGKS